MLNDSDSYMLRMEGLYTLGAIQQAHTRPSVLFRPSIHRNYDDYVATYSHITVRAKTPEAAMALFDEVWTKEVTGNPAPPGMEEFFDQQRKSGA